MPDVDFLRRRNSLWARLRALPPWTPEWEDTLAELRQLIGWSRERVLAGLGLDDSAPPSEGP